MAGKVVRMIVTFESAAALKASKDDVLQGFWNKDVLNPANIVQTMDALMKEIQQVDAWRSSPQLQSRMKCLAHTKKCWEEWGSASTKKNAQFQFSHYETLNVLVLTMTSSVPMRSKVYDFFKEEAKKPIAKAQAVEPFVGTKSKDAAMRNPLLF